jgi:hypothetical protein
MPWASTSEGPSKIGAAMGNTSSTKTAPVPSPRSGPEVVLQFQRILTAASGPLRARRCPVDNDWRLSWEDRRGRRANIPPFNDFDRDQLLAGYRGWVRVN